MFCTAGFRLEYFKVNSAFKRTVPVADRRVLTRIALSFEEDGRIAAEPLKAKTPVHPGRLSFVLESLEPSRARPWPFYLNC